MALFKKKKPEDDPKYKEQKEMMEKTQVEKTSGKPNKPVVEEQPPTLADVTLGMTDNEYRTQILAILLELNDKVEKLANEMHDEILRNRNNE